jgi:hypothetical protein
VININDLMPVEAEGSEAHIKDIKEERLEKLKALH